MTTEQSKKVAYLEARRAEIRSNLAGLHAQPDWSTDERAAVGELLAEQKQTEALLRAAYRRTPEEWADPSLPMTAAEISVADGATIDARIAWRKARQEELLAMHGGISPDQRDALRESVALPPIDPGRARHDLLN